MTTSTTPTTRRPGRGRTVTTVACTAISTVVMAVAAALAGRTARAEGFTDHTATFLVAALAAGGALFIALGLLHRWHGARR